MTIVVGWTPTPEGEAALDHAVAEARAHGSRLVVVNVSATSDPSEATFADEHELTAARSALESSGVRFTLRQLVRGRDAAEEIISVAREEHADFIVIGLRHRSPVGKLLLGSNSQSILLEAPCPVVAVKARRRAA